MDSGWKLNEELIKRLYDVTRIPVASMIQRTGIPRSTWYSIMGSPSGISIQQLLSISNGLQIPVRKFFYQGDTFCIGRCDDYVTDDYMTCYYDDAALRALVEDSRSATWQKAADMVGMSRSRLRDSLLAVSRTPVKRYLVVCSIFDINPFTILIDPNPDSQSRKRCTKPSSEITELRDQIATLTGRVDQLTERYQKLLDAHNFLVRRVNQQLSSMSSWMVADDGDEGQK